MDLTTSPTTKTPDSENDTPPQPRLKPLSFANGGATSALRKHSHHHAPPLAVVYKECLKNHAASMGGHAVDGCGEFMPAPEATTADPTSLKCAACGCHRNFHRREPPDDYSFSSPTHGGHGHVSSPHFIDFRHPFRRAASPSPSPPPPHSQHMLLALATAPEDSYHHNNNNHHLTPVTPTPAKTENTSGRKRFRTKFSQEQKEKMHNFSEKLGWKMQRSDDVSVERFCHEIGVSRGVLKVWMHNNKNTLGKKENHVSNGGFNVINGGSTKNDVVEYNNNSNSNSFNDNNASSSHCGNDQNISGGDDLNLHISH